MPFGPYIGIRKHLFQLHLRQIKVPYILRIITGNHQVERQFHLAILFPN